MVIFERKIEHIDVSKYDILFTTHMPMDGLQALRCTNKFVLKRGKEMLPDHFYGFCDHIHQLTSPLRLLRVATLFAVTYTSHNYACATLCKSC